MLSLEDRIDAAFTPYEPKLPDGMIHNDHLGTPQKMTDSSGAVVWSADYKPFGEATIATNTILNNLRFPGQYLDQETGLHYNYKRDYSPMVGRYIEADPLNLGSVHLFQPQRFKMSSKLKRAQRMSELYQEEPRRQHLYVYVGSVGKPLETNLYAYTGNNPVNRIDPLGLTWLEYDSGSGTLYIHPGDLNTQGPPSAAFDAFNNTDSSSRGDWQPGTYDFLYWVPHTGGGPDSRYGSNGNFVFDVPGCEGCGIHAGHANSCDKNSRCGAAHATNGCIRTTDDATFELRRIYHQNQDPIYFLIVR